MRSATFFLPLWLTATLFGCVEAADKPSLPSPTPQAVAPVQEQPVPVEESRRIQQDRTTLNRLLKQNGLLQQMQSWNGKALFVKVDETKTPPEHRYYHYNDLVVDQNQNGIQDSADSGFFNPASTVKVGISALVLEKLNQINLERSTEYRVSGTSQWYAIADDIQRALVISDNESTNRLILFLGFDRLNQEMQAKGLQHFAVNRLMLDKGTLIDSPPIELRSHHKVIQQPKQPVSVKASCWETKQKVGNCASSTDLIEVLIRVVQPELYGTTQGFNLKTADRIWLQQVMSRPPRQQGFDYPDDGCRFLHPLSKKLIQPDGRMLSKCGIGLFSPAYVDTSFIEIDQKQKYYVVLAVTASEKTEKEFILSWMNKTVSLILPQLP